MVYALKGRTTAPLCFLTDIQYIAFLPTSGSDAVVVRSDSIELRDLSSKSKQPKSECILSTMRLNVSLEIALVDIRNDAIEVITQGWWLTTIIVRRNRLFVSHRVKIMNSKPYDWSFQGEMIAFGTKDGKVLVTRTPSKAALRRQSEPLTAAKRPFHARGLSDNSDLACGLRRAPYLGPRAPCHSSPERPHASQLGTPGLAAHQRNLSVIAPYRMCALS
jgi:hypothetical protein